MWVATPDSSSKTDSESSNDSNKTTLKDPSGNHYPGILKVILCSLRSGMNSLEVITFLIVFNKEAVLEPFKNHSCLYIKFRQ